MSSGSSDSREHLITDFLREIRQFNSLGAFFFRAAAARLGMNVTDLQVIDLLEFAGPSTAGQLAELTGLTTGAITGVIDRLEKSGLVRRESDPNDGRRVLVRLSPNDTAVQKFAPVFDSVGQQWEELADNYDDEQKVFLLEFLQSGNALAREEITRLREAPLGDEGIFSAPLGDLESARLVFHFEGAQLSLRAGNLASAFYQARFEGPVPDVKVKDGVVIIRYPRRLWLLGMQKRAAEVTLSTAIPWQIALKGGGAMVTAELGGLNLLELEANGTGSMFHLDLPEPTRVVPIRLGGSGSEFTVRRPPGVAARVHLKGWGSGVTLDDQTAGGISSEVRLQSPNYEGAARRYTIETSGSGSMITVSTVQI